MRFILFAILVAGCLFGIGYYPAKSYDAEHGIVGLACGIALSFTLMVPSYYLMCWALSRSQRIFMVTFGAGFLIRLVLFIVLFILYSKLVREKDFCFGLAFGTCYLFLNVLEVFFFKGSLHKGS